MPRGDQLARQWKIIQTLISSRLGKLAAELAEELECHPRTVCRDLEALQVAGFPIYTERVERILLKYRRISTSKSLRRRALGYSKVRR